MTLVNEITRKFSRHPPVIAMYGNMPKMRQFQSLESTDVTLIRLARGMRFLSGRQKFLQII